MSGEKVELLAPAGSPEGFYGAIHAGADAVYLGGTKFGARAYADNFTEEELVSCIRYAHIWGRRVYLTVNTLVKEAEFTELFSYLKPYYEAGLDGVIVQDMGVFLFVKEHFPGMELHVSTQMTLTGKYGAKMLRDLGACRIVPARELSLAEIKYIKEETGLEIEAFIHGAMCYCYSGQCLFSSILGGRSGNRGRCAQPCRLPYQAWINGKKGREGHYLSLKDMCTIEHIPELIEAGIDSFKIEGRMKKPEYTAGVTSIYRKYIDRYYDRKEQLQIEKRDMEALSHLYIRSERQNGYYHKHNGADMVTLQNPSYSGSDEVLLEEIRKRFLEQKPVMDIEIEASFRIGKAAEITFTLPGTRSRFGSGLQEALSVTVTGEEVTPAMKQPVTEENIVKQISKLGDSCFRAKQIKTVLDEAVFYPLKSINQLRRRGIAALEEKLIEGYGLCAGRSCEAGHSAVGERNANTEVGVSAEIEVGVNAAAVERRANSFTGAPGISVAVHTKEQLHALLAHLEQSKEEGIRRVYVEGDFFVDSGDNMGIPNSQEIEWFLALPPILRKRDEKYLTDMERILRQRGKEEAFFKGCLVRSLEGFAWLKEIQYQGRIASDSGIYIWNRNTLHYWQKHLDSFALPLELNGKEQQVLTNAALSAVPEKLIYGRIPMMITANCIANTCGTCLKNDKEKQLRLTDRYQKQFPVVPNCIHCMNTIYNSVPLSLHKECTKWKDKAMLRLEFTTETGSEMTAVLQAFQEILWNRGTGSLPFSDYTAGHEKRGVE